MLNLFNIINNLNGIKKALIAFLFALPLGLSSGYLAINNDAGMTLFPSILGSLCLCIVMYLNIYIQNGFKFEKIFYNNLSELVNMVGLVFCIVACLLVLLGLYPLVQIFSTTGVIHIIASIFIAIKKGQPK
jgi:hypothetical protein